MKSVIIKLAKEFNQEDVVWAIGGSYLLKRYGINSESNELDIMVSKDSIASVTNIMNELSVEEEVENDKHYQTDYFGVYMIDGLRVNIIYNLKSNFNEVFNYNFTQEDIHLHESYDGESVYYGYLIDWYLIFSEIEKKDDLLSMKKYYIDGGFFNNERFVTKFQQSNFQVLDFHYKDLKSKLY